MKVSKDEIILAARELFREKGYAGASMQDLADRVGLRKASLYMRFPNKEALVPEVLEMTLNTTFSQPGISSPDWKTAYEAVIRSIAAALTDRHRCVGFHLAYGIGDDTPLAKQAVRDFFRSHLDRMTDILARAMPRETATIIAADDLARLEGATLHLALFDDPTSMKRAVDLALGPVRSH
ncbi:TetR family transcriptional regulator [Rhizobiales bacterium RZME27]|jgi:TetR/AcrR family transcriptional repressor of nem operon|uniref:TetR family transcriptional regulator n=1 Tax=Endobacterium cereale TaxID=2663029 RepID=A0A6A8A1J8_9HYPH|nr:TetR/AcrR family transcriptional regulator [Endobacterium cereale]MEB2844930.1 helix-turn-helix domain-containing protein [Endobacterium cereale]MQY44842.1 TetR family transcriptional regulator [Endobacterium cereale]